MAAGMVAMTIFDGMSSGTVLDVTSRFPERGSIYDRNGEFLVESRGPIVAIYGVQQDMNGVDECVELLAVMMRRQINEINRRFIDFLPDARFHIGEIDLPTYFEYQDRLNNICGIFDDGSAISRVLQYEDRRYDGHGSAAHVTGYIGRIPSEEVNRWEARGYSPNDIVGLTGIENSFQDELAGRPERFLRLIEVNTGTPIRELGGAIGTDATDVHLTIDRNLQTITSQAIVDAFNYAAGNWAAFSLGGGAVVMDVNSGEILALASYPTFDPSVFNPETSYTVSAFEAISRDVRFPLQNKAVSEQYTPGSVYKIITTLAAASEDIWTRNRPFQCELEWRGAERLGDGVEARYDWRILNELDEAGEINMVQALATSCNPFFWEMGGLMFRQDPLMLVDYSEQVGLGGPPNINGRPNLLAREASGNLAPPRTAFDAINNAIGQGDVSLSILQMATAVSTIANGGTLYQPMLVSHLGQRGTESYQLVSEPTVLEQLDLDPEALSIVQDGMCSVITDEDFGTASFVFEGASYTLCGKTGTAQTAGFPNAWFVAYTPAIDPEIAIVVMMSNSREGSEVAAPIVRRILDQYYAAPIEPFPEWWFELEYIPLDIQTGSDIPRDTEENEDG